MKPVSPLSGNFSAIDGGVVSKTRTTSTGSLRLPRASSATTASANVPSLVSTVSSTSKLQVASLPSGAISHVGETRGAVAVYEEEARRERLGA